MRKLRVWMRAETGRSLLSFSPPEKSTLLRGPILRAFPPPAPSFPPPPPRAQGNTTPLTLCRENTRPTPTGHACAPRNEQPRARARRAGAHLSPRAQPPPLPLVFLPHVSHGSHTRCHPRPPPPGGAAADRCGGRDHPCCDCAAGRRRHPRPLRHPGCCLYLTSDHPLNRVRGDRRDRPPMRRSRARHACMDHRDWRPRRLGGRGTGEQ